MSSEEPVNKELSPHPFDLLLDIDKRAGSRVPPKVAEVARSAGMRGRLVFRLGVWNLMLAMQDMSEIIPVPRVTQVPGVKSWLMGIANLRGAVMSVVDLREFFDGKSTVPTPNSRLVVVRSGEWSYGLLVDEVIGMRYFGLEKKLPTLNAIDAKLHSYVTEAFESENQLWLALNVSGLLNASEFLDAAN